MLIQIILVSSFLLIGPNKINGDAIIAYQETATFGPNEDVPLACEVPSVPNGFIFSEGSTIQPGHVVLPGSTISLVCKPGFTVVGVESTVCLSDGTFHAGLGGCVAFITSPSRTTRTTRTRPPTVATAAPVTDCFVPDLLGQNGTYRLVNGGAVFGYSFLQIGSAVTLQCNDGYARTSSDPSVQISVCDYTGHWSPNIAEIGKCVKISNKNCPNIVPFPVLNGRIEDGPTYVGTILDVKCDAGYGIVGRGYIFCQNNSTWSAPGICQPISGNRVPVTPGSIPTTTRRNFLPGGNSFTFMTLNPYIFPMLIPPTTTPLSRDSFRYSDFPWYPITTTRSPPVFLPTFRMPQYSVRPPVDTWRVDPGPRERPNLYQKK